MEEYFEPVRMAISNEVSLYYLRLTLSFNQAADCSILVF